MALFTPDERAFASAVGRVTYCNPFLPERIIRERGALGPEFVETAADWNRNACSKGLHANITRLTERAGEVAEAARSRLRGGARPGDAELRLYEDLVLFFLYHQYYDRLTTVMATPPAVGGAKPRITVYRAFAAEAAHFLEIPGVDMPGRESPEHLFACFFQIRRAF